MTYPQKEVNDGLDSTNLYTCRHLPIHHMKFHEIITTEDQMMVTQARAHIAYTIQGAVGVVVNITTVLGTRKWSAHWPQSEIKPLASVDA